MYTHTHTHTHIPTCARATPRHRGIKMQNSEEHPNHHHYDDMWHITDCMVATLLPGVALSPVKRVRRRSEDWGRCTRTQAHRYTQMHARSHTHTHILTRMQACD